MSAVAVLRQHADLGLRLLDSGGGFLQFLLEGSAFLPQLLHLGISLGEFR